MQERSDEQLMRAVMAGDQAAQTAGSVWSVTTDQATAMQLQASYQVSTMINQLHGITLRIVSASRPHEAAVVIDPSLVETYLLATSRHEVRV
jgi:ABC-2 type transport system ATP-binding protein